MRDFTRFLERIYLIPELGRGLSRKAFEDFCKIAWGGEPTIDSDFADVFLGIFHHDSRLINPVCIQVLQEVQSCHFLEETTEMAL